MEHIAVLKQQTDNRTGELSDNFELNYYKGILTQEVYEELVDLAKKKDDEEDVSKRIVISFKV